MIFGRKLRNTEAKQMLDHINYMQGILEREFENIGKKFADMEAKLIIMDDKITAHINEEETEG